MEISTMVNAVRSFMRAADQATPATFHAPDDATLQLRADLIIEEAAEFAEVCEWLQHLIPGSFDYKETELLAVKELMDVLYVTIGALVAFGVEPNMVGRLFADVHDSNMSKVPFERDENGKVRKGSNFKPPENLRNLVDSIR